MQNLIEAVELKPSDSEHHRLAVINLKASGKQGLGSDNNKSDHFHSAVSL